MGSTQPGVQEEEEPEKGRRREGRETKWGALGGKRRSEDCGEFPRPAPGAGIHPPVSVYLLLPEWRRRKAEDV